MVPTEFVVDADGERIVMFGSGKVRFRRSGKVADSPLVHFWRFKEGKAVEFREYYDTAGAFAAATPDPA
jgi:ketosteroid isomerase-like protein